MPKGRKSAIDAQGVGIAKKKGGEDLFVEEIETVPEERTVYNSENEAIEKPLKKGDNYLIYIDGREHYMTRTRINILFQRDSGNRKIEIPKGSDIIVPKNVKLKNCINCG